MSPQHSPLPGERAASRILGAGFVTALAVALVGLAWPRHDGGGWVAATGVLLATPWGVLVVELLVQARRGAWRRLLVTLGLIALALFLVTGM